MISASQVNTYPKGDCALSPSREAKAACDAPDLPVPVLAEPSNKRAGAPQTSGEARESTSNVTECRKLRLIAAGNSSNPLPISEEAHCKSIGIRASGVGDYFEASGGVASEDTQRDHEREPGELSHRQQSVTPDQQPGPLASF